MNTIPAIQVKPISSLNRTRRHREGQAQALQEYVDARKRERRLQVIPKTVITEDETDAIVECMDAFGWPLMWAAIIAILTVMLVNHYGWWIVPGLASVWGLKKIWGRLWQQQ